MSACYPTGCAPCEEPIDFPDNPLNGDVYCVMASGDINKCWVYDHCIPGWRAQGPAASPSVYRGAINVDTETPGNNIEAGHFYVQTETVRAPYKADWGLNATSPIQQNSRIAFNGQRWQVIPGPEVQYVEEAEQETPKPDNRVGGITKSASAQEAVEGTNKCHQITPWTLNKALADFEKDIPDLIGNGKVRFVTDKGDGIGAIEMNQFTDETITIPTSDVTAPGNGQITIQQNGKTQGSFTVNQSSNQTINLQDSFDNTSLPGEILGQVVGNRLITSRNISSFGRSHEGQYFYNTRLTGLSFDNLIYSVSCDAGIRDDGGGRAGTICVNKIKNGNQIRVQTANGYSNPGNISEQILIAWVK